MRIKRKTRKCRVRLHQAVHPVATGAAGGRAAEVSERVADLFGGLRVVIGDGYEFTHGSFLR